MDRWMDGWVGEWIDGWIDGWMNGWDLLCFPENIVIIQNGN